MFNLPNPLFVASSFLGLVVSVSRCEGGPTVAWCERVENPDIKKCTLMPVTPNPCAHTSSSELEVLCESLSPVIGCTHQYIISVHQYIISLSTIVATAVTTVTVVTTLPTVMIVHTVTVSLA